MLLLLATASCTRPVALQPRPATTGDSVLLEQPGVHFVAMDAQQVYVLAQPEGRKTHDLLAIPRGGGAPLRLAQAFEPRELALTTDHVWWLGGDGLERVGKHGGVVEEMPLPPRRPDEDWRRFGVHLAALGDEVWLIDQQGHAPPCVHVIRRGERTPVKMSEGNGEAWKWIATVAAGDGEVVAYRSGVGALRLRDGQMVDIAVPGVADLYSPFMVATARGWIMVGNGGVARAAPLAGGPSWDLVGLGRCIVQLVGGGGHLVVMSTVGEGSRYGCSPDEAAPVRIDLLAPQAEGAPLRQFLGSSSDVKAAAVDAGALVWIAGDRLILRRL